MLEALENMNAAINKLGAIIQDLKTDIDGEELFNIQTGETIGELDNLKQDQLKELLK